MLGMPATHLLWTITDQLVKDQILHGILVTLFNPLRKHENSGNTLVSTISVHIQSSNDFSFRDDVRSVDSSAFQVH